MLTPEQPSPETSAKATKATLAQSAFERLAGFVAIRQTQKGDEVLEQLLLHVATTPAARELASAAAFSQQVETLFGLRVSRSRIQSALDSLASKGSLSKLAGAPYVLTANARSKILGRIEEARELERRVRDQWLARSQQTHPELDTNEAWKALEMYLIRAFRQHGIQTVALLDPAIDIPPDLQAGLRTMLNEALSATCALDQREHALECISEFLVNAGRDADRSAFVARMADCAVSYFSLTVPPDIASQLKSKLRPLTVFLDTNVLFGLVGLDDQPVVEVSDELVSLVRDERLPIVLRYHAETAGELRRTFETVTSSLKGSAWSPAVSRGAAKSPRVSTIQRLFHERNAIQPITAETFFKPYEHMDVLIQQRGISLYREAQPVEVQRIYDLEADFRAFLEAANRVKPYEAIEHDMTLLDCVRRLRTKAKSSLEAGALCVTTDHLLWVFDRRQSRSSGGFPTMILPPQLLQLLRPFVTITPDFDRSFADSFAIPEFRALGDGAQAAAGRMLEIVSAYGDIASETVTSLLANDLFLEGLSRRKESEIREYVESAIVAENARLGRDKALVEERLAKELRERDAFVERSRQALEAEAALKVNAAEEESARNRAVADSARNAAEQARLAAERADLERRDATALMRTEANRRAEAELRATNAEEAAKESAAAVRRQDLVLALVVGISASAMLEAGIHVLKYSWLLGHPNSYGLRIGTYLMLCGVAIAYWRRDWTRTTLTLCVLPALYVVLQLLGGPSKP